MNGTTQTKLSARQLLDFAVQRHQQGALDEALQHYRQLIQHLPKHSDAWNLSGLVCYQQNNFIEAEPLFRQAIELRPDVAYFHGNLGLVLQALQRHAEAEAAYREGLRLQSENLEILNNLGTLLELLGRLDEAEAVYLQAIKRHGKSSDSLYNLGHVRFQLRNLQGAIAAYEQALAVVPDEAKVHWNLALALLMSGDLKRGFLEYEYRWQGSIDAVGTRPLPGRKWQGEVLDEATIVVYREQGLGDTLQLVRYLPMLARRAKKVIFLCEAALERLVRFSWGHVLEVRVESNLPKPAEYDFQIALFSLPPLLAGTREVGFSGLTPYLLPLPQLASRWGARLSSLAGLRVGLVWAGQVSNRMDQRRSISLEQWLPILQVPQVSLVSLQKESDDAAKALMASSGVYDWMGEVKDFADTAALVAGLDLVIGVDTSVVHLAGALGKPVWLLNRFESEWRWQLGRTDSPWYPTLRIFNQTERNDWAPILASVAQALHEVTAIRVP